MSGIPIPIQKLNRIEVPDRVIIIKDLAYKNRGTLEHYDSKSGTKRQNDAKNSEEKKSI